MIEKQAIEDRVIVLRRRLTERADTPKCRDWCGECPACIRQEIEALTGRTETPDGSHAK